MFSPRSARAAGAVVIASLACAVPAAAQTGAPAPSPPPTIGVTGTATVKPTPLNRKSSPSIAKAVRDARAAATPLALADGRARAANLAAQAGFVLGPLLEITESPASPFAFAIGPMYGQEGTFGPGKYCGTVRTPIFRRTPSGGRKLVRYRTRHTCRVPPRVGATLGMTFATTPPA